MLLFLFFLALLILAYFFYSSYLEKIFGADPSKKTPAIKYRDDVDFMPLPKYKIFLIQFLNIAGLGPVYGPILGAIYGPSCLLWIVFGGIFGGAVHDYLSGMLSVRYKGKSPTFLVEKLFGNFAKISLFIFLAIILILVGTVFATAPANMLKELKFGDSIPQLSYSFWITIIFLYYFLSTFLPIDKIIAKLYPFFGLTLLIVTFGLFCTLFKTGDILYTLPLFENLHPNHEPLFPVLFITIACGAISGFHATQSPMMARCLTNEKDGRKIFYGAMICESIVALVWASAGIGFYKETGGLLNVVEKSGPNGAILEMSNYFFGNIGGILTVLAVVFLSITSGDTAFRSARLTIADSFNLSQKKTLNRLILSILVLTIGIFLSSISISELWKYFGWANQSLAAIMLWTISIYLKRKNKNYFVTFLPAIFMTAVCISFILYIKIGFNLNLNLSIFIGILTSIVASILFLRSKITKKTH